MSSVLELPDEAEGHRIELGGVKYLPDHAGILMFCECGWRTYPRDGHLEDLNQIANRHRFDARVAERNAKAARERAASRWHLWVKNAKGEQFIYHCTNDQLEAQHWKDRIDDTFSDEPNHLCWIQDRDGVS